MPNRETTRPFADADEPTPHAPLTMQTGLNIALVVLLIGAAITYGRQSQRLDSIENEVKDARAEVREMRTEVRALRELLIQRTSLTPPTP